ncbi:hypothetical protein WG904_06285 [Pedobacter sp. Du54]|uniref:hypothetical protein n=1 Tax=Pedobacter anseongensis TaxID=3133439 RepID=UPI0030B197DE
MKRFIIFFLLICSLIFAPCSLIFAQDFKLNGVVFEKETKQRVALVEITNKRNKYSVGSNDIGIFLINASIGDTLLIIKRGFNDQQVVVRSTNDLIIYLNRGISLNTVEIKGESKKQTLDAIKRDFKNKGSFYAGKPPFLSFLFTPLTALYELVGRTPKNARRFSRYYATEMQQTHIDGFFNKSIISANTGLAGKALDNFMINYRPEYEQSKNWNTYDGLKWIRESFKKYSDTAGKR